MKDRATLARGWLRKGDSDLFNARHMLDTVGPYDTVCFHAQQAAEKYLKGFLALHAQPIPRTHDLEELARLSVALEAIPELGALDLDALSGYAIEPRYDDEFWPSRETAAVAVVQSERVRSIILTHMPPEARP